MNIRLEHKRTLVTGGNSGIGAAIALADAGARMAINYMSHPEAADPLVQTVTQKQGEAIAIQADVSDPQGVADLFRQIDAAWGGSIFSSITSALTVPAPWAGRPKAGTFWLYGTVSAGAWLFAFFLVLETRGKSLEEIEAHWRAGQHPRAMISRTG